ncbi:hypothetical protein [Bartonella taylorii]|uniref:hypothetical protein n=1 Tax=Bartonella taylorii TaxID=33046 RepID=UPI001ABA824C|nr:hypothetical protein [Bartonella taylorii]
MNCGAWSAGGTYEIRSRIVEKSKEIKKLYFLGWRGNQFLLVIKIIRLRVIGVGLRLETEERRKNAFYECFRVLFASGWQRAMVPLVTNFLKKVANFLENPKGKDQNAVLMYT